MGRSGSRGGGLPGAGAGSGGGGAPALFGNGSSSARAGSAGSSSPGAVRTGGAGFTGGGPGGGETSTSAALTKALETDAGRYRWVAATSGSQSAATLELSSGEPVMAIGGFSGEGGNLTLAQFEAYVKKGEIHYWIGGAGMGGGPGRSGSTSQIEEWVTQHYKSVTIGGQTVYDLTISA